MAGKSATSLTRPSLSRLSSGANSVGHPDEHRNGTAGGVKKPKHVPQRTCVGCRTVLAKRALVRVVRCPDGVFIDPSGKMNGRGAYVHDRKSCWERSLKGPLVNALKVTLTAEDRQRLEDYMASLPEESAEPATGTNHAGAQA